MSRIIKRLVFCGLFVTPLLASAANVVVDGREWRQLTDTDTTSYASFVSACSAVTGVCNGAFDGWTWASNSDVQGLFDELIQPGTTNFPTAFSDYAAAASPDIEAAVGSPNFAVTYYASFSGGDFEFVRGITRDLASTGISFRPELQAANPSSDHAHLSDTIASDTTNLFQRGGAWMYVTTTPVPLPAAVWLLASGIGALATLARRRREVVG